MSVSFLPSVSLRLPRWRALRADLRQHRRYACCMPATIRYDGTHHDDVGLVLELSCAGIVFREASAFVMDRAGTRAEVVADDLLLSGSIVRSDPRGHAIRLDSPLGDDQVAALVETYGLERAG